MEVNKEVGHDQQMIPNDFQVIWAKVKVIMTFNSRTASGW